MSQLAPKSQKLDSDCLPNVVIISQEIPQTIYAGNILLFRLLKDYPPEKLLIFGPRRDPEAESLTCRYEIFQPTLERLDRTRFGRLSRTLKVHGVIPRDSVRTVATRLGEFRPDLVLSVMQTRSFYETAFRFAKSKSLPLMLIVYDLPESFENVYPWAKRQEGHRNTAIYRYASKRLCVSSELNEHLRECYGRMGEVLYPNRSEEVSPRPSYEAKNLKNSGSLTVGYAGTLAYGYGDQLRRMLPAFREAGAKLRIYSKGQLGSDEGDVVTYCGYAPLPETTWSRIKKECDSVILPYCWPDDGHEDLYKIHFPSKLPEYLALGMPVLIVGPEYATGIRWALKNPRAVSVVCKRDQSAWVSALTKLAHSASFREELSRNALFAAKRDFDPSKIRNQFLSHLTEVGSSSVL